MPAISTMTLKYLRDKEYLYDTTERWIRFHGKFGGQQSIRKDMFGFGDFIAIRKDKQGALSIQACDHTSHSKRITKSLANDKLSVWLMAGNRYVVLSWHKYGKRGKKKFWKPRITKFSITKDGTLHTEDIYPEYEYSEVRQKTCASCKFYHAGWCERTDTKSKTKSSSKACINHKRKAKKGCSVAAQAKQDCPLGHDRTVPKNNTGRRTTK